MIRLIRRVRRSLARIRYYSANRPRTRVSIASDWAAVLTLPLAVALVLAAEGMVEQLGVLSTTTGRIAQSDNGKITASVDAPGDAWPRGVIGEWTLDVGRTNRGWPITTVERSTDPRLTLNLYNAVGNTRGSSLPADSPYRVAIDDALRSSGGGTPLSASAGGTTATTTRPAVRHWKGTIGSVMAWWAALFVVAAILIRVVGFAALVQRSRRVDKASHRSATGRCSACDYDLRGTEFSARCPECGALVK